MRRSSRLILAWAGLGVTLALAGWALEQGSMRVTARVENFREAPNGKRLGTLLQGARIERISQDGNWVHFRIEGWIWGPSLEGFVAEPERGSRTAPELPSPLDDATPRLRRFIESLHGTFYSVDYDPDLQRITLRFRIHAQNPVNLQEVQMKTQRKLFEILRGKLVFSTLRVETNRADGTGRVGVEVAQIQADSLAALPPADLEDWRKKGRLSHDEGRTWDR